ncbi:MAG: hypothetical protein ABSF28_17705 [Terracidiphilus sp.]|jgi:hypothetical protein
MILPEDEEPEGEQWHEKISHEDQTEFFSEKAEAELKIVSASAEETTDPSQANPSGANLITDQKSIPAAKHGEAPFHEVWIPRLQKFFESPVNRYATLVIGLGILVGAAVASITWYTSNPSGRYDLGPMTSDAVGLKGRLFVKWDKTLQYRVGFEPTYADQIPGFSLAAGNSPRPASISIQLRDVQGFELCSKTILLRYDPRRAEAFEPLAHTEEKPADTDLASALAHGLDEVHQDAQEAAREQGKDIFDLQVGPDGQIASINAKGELPCTLSNYEDATSWSFVPDFPSLAEQTGLLKKLRERREEEANQAIEAAKPRKPKAVKPAPNTVLYYIEGDDAIVDFDASTGSITTRSRKLFSIERGGAEAALLKGSDLPMRIHYRCDQNGNCSLMSHGAGVLHARLRR